MSEVNWPIPADPDPPNSVDNDLMTSLASGDEFELASLSGGDVNVCAPAAGPMSAVLPPSPKATSPTLTLTALPRLSFRAISPTHTESSAVPTRLSPSQSPTEGWNGLKPEFSMLPDTSAT